jgi:hypothetical protein
MNEDQYLCGNALQSALKPLIARFGPWRIIYAIVCMKWDELRTNRLLATLSVQTREDIGLPVQKPTRSARMLLWDIHL